MSHQWQPFDGDRPAADESNAAPSSTDINDWAELFATTIAHLAAQLTMTQLRLRALGTVAAESGLVDAGAVRERLGLIAELAAGQYLKENLGDALADAIDVESLERDIVAFLRGEAASG